MQLVLDPARLAPPSGISDKAWLEEMRSLLALIVDGGVSVVCPKKLRDAMYLRWFEGSGQNENVRYLNEVAERLSESVSLSQGPALLENVRLKPRYVSDLLDASTRNDFTNQIGEAALAQEDGDSHLGVLTEGKSWDAESDAVLVEGEIHCREDPSGEWFEPEDGDSDLRAFLPLASSSVQVLSSCARDPMALMDCIEFGIEAYWVGELDGKPGELAFDIGSELAKSLKAMNYHRNHRYAASCLRVMALIAAGREKEIEGHEERDGSGASNPTIKDADGRPVMRAYLAKKSPNANRLFWVRGERPKFLNVTGHEGRPAL